MKKINIPQFNNGFCYYFKSNFDKVIKLFTLFSLHPGVIATCATCCIFSSLCFLVSFINPSKYSNSLGIVKMVSKSVNDISYPLRKVKNLGLAMINSCPNLQCLPHEVFLSLVNLWCNNWIPPPWDSSSWKDIILHSTLPIQLC